MGKASRAKRKRAAVRSAKRSRQNTWWYWLTAFIVVVGVALIVFAKATAPAAVGPFIADGTGASNNNNNNSHWHAALGVYDCDHWVGDSTGSGVWLWPASTPSNSPARAGQTNVYAGLHSHADGIIHMEPAANEEAGRHATIGKYFSYGGWSLSATSYDFVGTKARNDDKCGDATGTLQWETAKFNGNVDAPQKFTVRTGNPATYKLYNDDIVVIAFLPPGKTIESLGNPPSLKNLPDAANREGQTMPPSDATTVPGGSTGSTAPATSAPPTTTATPTSKP